MVLLSQMTVELAKVIAMDMFHMTAALTFDDEAVLAAEMGGTILISGPVIGNDFVYNALLLQLFQLAVYGSQADGLALLME